MASNLNEFVQLVKVVGADEAIRILREMGINTAELGKESEAAGKKTASLGDSAKQMVAGYLGFGAVVDLFRNYLQALDEVIRKQAELAGNAVVVASAAKPLARQLGVSEADSVRILTRIRKEGGLDADTASQFGIAADIAFSSQGGLLAGQNFKNAREVMGAYAGARGFEGKEAATLVELLKTVDALGSTEETKRAIAKVNAAAKEARATTTGAFVSAVAGGGTGLLQAGVSLDNVLELAGQARAVEGNEALAAESVRTLEQVAVAGAEKKFTKLINERAKKEGQDPANLSAAQRVQYTRDIFGEANTQQDLDALAKTVSAERFLRMSKFLRASTVAASQPIADAIRGASPGDVDVSIAEGQSELSARNARTQAEIDFSAYEVGTQVTTISDARQRAKARLDADIARGIVIVTDRSREGEEEKYVLRILQEEADKLRAAGVDIGDIQGQIDSPGPYSQMWGYDDVKLGRAAGLIDNAQRRLRLDQAAERRPTVINHITNVATQYNDRDPLTDPPRDIDLSE